jgi:hypothetical protein
MSGPSSLDKAIAKRKKDQKDTAAWWACGAWVVSGVYLFATTPTASFLSVKALLFFLVGTYAASLTIGSAAYLVKRSIAWSAMKLVRSPGRKVAALVNAIGQALVIAEVCVAYFAARLVLSSMG